MCLLEWIVFFICCLSFGSPDQVHYANEWVVEFHEHTTEEYVNALAKTNGFRYFGKVGFATHAYLSFIQ